MQNYAKLRYIDGIVSEYVVCTQIFSERRTGISCGGGCDSRSLYRRSLWSVMRQPSLSDPEP